MTLDQICRNIPSHHFLVKLRAFECSDMLKIRHIMLFMKRVHSEDLYDYGWFGLTSAKFKVLNSSIR